MVEADKKRFAQAMGTMGEIFDKAMTPVQLRVYFETMRNFSIEQVEDAITRAMTSCRFFPKPVEIIENITGGTQSLADRAEIEGDKALKAIKTHGAYQSVVFDDAVTQAVIVNAFGGWIKMCQDLAAGEEKWFRRDFAKAYQTYARSKIEHCGHLAGVIERENSQMGYLECIPEPACIGNEEKARRIRHKAGARIESGPTPGRVLKLVEGIGA